MNTKIQNNVSQDDLKLTWDEIKKVAGFSDISAEEAELLGDFIYRISSILYKTNSNAQP